MPFSAVRYVSAPSFAILFKDSFDAEYYSLSKLLDGGEYVTDVIPFYSEQIVLNSLERERVLLATGYRLDHFRVQLKFNYDLPSLDDVGTLVYFVTHSDRFNTFPSFQQKLFK